MKTRQGVKNFTQEEATRVAGEDPDYMIRDMFDAIERKDFPQWDVFVQVMSPSEAETYRWNIFDMTKVWPKKDFPLRKIGQMTLNRNVSYGSPEIDAYSNRLARQLFYRHRTGRFLAFHHGSRICSFR